MPAKDMAKYMRERRERRRAELIQLKGGMCEVCGTPDSLEFNHLDRTVKRFKLTGKDLDRSWETILSELEKCNLLCTEHHLEYTRRQHANGEIVPWNKGLTG